VTCRVQAAGEKLVPLWSRSGGTRLGDNCGIFLRDHHRRYPAHRRIRLSFACSKALALPSRNTLDAGARNAASFCHRIRRQISAEPGIPLTRPRRGGGRWQRRDDWRFFRHGASVASLTAIGLCPPLNSALRSSTTQSPRRRASPGSGSNRSTRSLCCRRPHGR
jgi:hypothetical protein